MSPIRRLRLTCPTALLLVLAMLLPILAGCGRSSDTSSTSGANLPPVDDTRGGTVAANAPPTRPTAKPGMSTGEKMVLLAGAAALYYMYKKQRDAQNQPVKTQYYLSKNGRVYYRDAQGRAHWVTPPPQGIQVPADEAQQFQTFQGYNGQTSGRDLAGLGAD
jgi:hypothetical protein